MADLTAAQLAWLRDTVGDTPTDAELQERFTRYESLRDAAISVLRDRRRDLLDSPLKVSVSGVASVDNSGNVQALERQIAELARLDDDPTDEVGETSGADETEHYTLTRTRRR